ncbi:outer membrane biogenesis protein BamB [Planctomycetes bacterium Pan216]|uniref:Outer membrane biogenesis protein BamB n=1 Tax=Kolteria novifilia TaxID=2527975 RepID=A0A518BAX9_9BACT|nr:outer membrane biogenesis protein BamB [Planctomycetes bacterium Pan216]
MRRLPFVLFVLALPLTASADDWPQWRGPERDGVWRETGIVKKLPAKLEPMWSTPIGLGYAGPAVVGDKVYVTDRQLAKDAANPENPFDKTPVPGNERVLCLDGKTGEFLWKHEYPCRYRISYPSGPRATPTIDGGKVYSLGAMGNFFCLDAESGKVLWSKDLLEDFGAEINAWGYAAAPLIDGDNVILLVGGSDKRGVMAFNKETGEEVWGALEAVDPGYAAPMIFEAGGKRQLIVWDPYGLYALDPKTGDLFWEHKYNQPLRYGMSIATPIQNDAKDLLFVSAFYDGPLMMKLAANKPTAQMLWEGQSDSEINTDGLHAVMCTPVFKDNYLYGVGSYGALRCLESESGKRIWESYKPTGKGRWWNAFIVPHEDRYFLSNEQGDLIIAKFSPKGYEEISRAFLIEPTNRARRRKVVWSHPAYANKSVYSRNDEKILRVDLAEK